MLDARWIEGRVTERLSGPIVLLGEKDELVATRDGFFVGSQMLLQLDGSCIPNGVAKKFDVHGVAVGEGRFSAGRMTNGWQLTKQTLYEGEWCNGLRQGKGKLTHLEGIHKGVTTNTAHSHTDTESSQTKLQ